MGSPRLHILCCLLVASAVQAANIPVTTTTDELNTDGDCSLREAVVAANTDAAVDACPAGSGADLILVPAGTYTMALTGANENSAATGDLDLTGTVQIVGATRATTILEGNADDRFFEVRSSAVATIASMTLQNATPMQAGAAVMNRATLTITDCDLENNLADGTTGGAVYSLSGTTLDITNSTFSGNEAGTNGGAIANSATATIANVTFLSNVAVERGGAIYQSPNGSLDLDAVSFILNDTDEDGGALYVDAPTTIDDSLFYLNTVGTAGLGGGAMSCGDTVTISGTTIAYNTSAVWAGGISTNASCTLTLTNVTVHGNEAADEGGGIRTAGGGTITLANATITGNQSNSDATGIDGGGGINCSSGGTVTLRNTVVADNLDDATASDCEGTLTSEGHNLIENTTGCTMALGTGDQTGLDPALGALASNGGPTDTRLPDAGSPLLEAGDTGTPGSGGTACAAVDQRGFARPAGTTCDIGAVERDAVLATTTTTVATTTTTTTTVATTTTTTTVAITTTTTTVATTTTTVGATTTTTTLAGTTTTTTTLPGTTTTTTLPGPTTTTTTPAPTTTSTSTPVPSTMPPPSTTTTTLPPPLCRDGAFMQGMTLRLTRVAGTNGDERMVLAGTLMLPPGTPPVLEPQTSGLQLLLEDQGAGGPMLDLTAATAPIPPGGKGSGCHPKDGWTGGTYANRSGAVAPPACPPGSARGVRRVKLKDRRARGRGVGFSILAQNATLPPPIGPVRVTLVLGSQREAGAIGLCGTYVFSASCTVKGSTYRCR